MRPAGVHAGRAAAPRSRLYQTSLSNEEGSAAVFSLHYESQASGGSEPAESSSKYSMLCRLRTEAGTGNLPWPSSTSVRFHGASARRAIRAYGRERAHAGFESAPHAQSRFLPAATVSGSSGGERRKASRLCLRCGKAARRVGSSWLQRWLQLQQSSANDHCLSPFCTFSLERGLPEQLTKRVQCGVRQSCPVETTASFARHDDGRAFRDAPPLFAL